MDQPFAEDERTALPHLEQLLLYSMRAWVIGYCRGLPIAERLDEVFAVIGAILKGQVALPPAPSRSQVPS